MITDLKRMAEEEDDETTFRTRLLDAVRASSNYRLKFSRLLLTGRASRELLKGWAVNWFCFEKNVPRKDAAIISNCDLISVRRLWVTKILEHDGYGSNEGAIEGWLKFAAGLGLTSQKVAGARYLEDVESAVSDYLDYVRSKSWVEGVATSVGMLFVPELVAQRLVAFRRHYSWVDPDATDYFRLLYSKARKDGRTALQLVLKYADNPALRESSIRAAKLGSEVQESILSSIMRDFGQSIDS